MCIRDSSIAGLEDICVVERKDLADLVHSFTATRSVFVDRLKRMTPYPHRLLVVTAALSQVKSAYPQGRANPNRIFQSLIALLAGFNIPFLCTCLLYTSDAADDLTRVDLGGGRVIKKT